MTVKEYVLRRLNQGETDLKVLARQTRIQIRDVLGLKPANLQRHRPAPAPSFFFLLYQKGRDSRIFQDEGRSSAGLPSLTLFPKGELESGSSPIVRTHLKR